MLEPYAAYSPTGKVAQRLTWLLTLRDLSTALTAPAGTVAAAASHPVVTPSLSGGAYRASVPRGQCDGDTDRDHRRRPGRIRVGPGGRPARRAGHRHRPRRARRRLRAHRLRAQQDAHRDQRPGDRVPRRPAGGRRLGRRTSRSIVATVNGRIKELAHQQSEDIGERLRREGVTVLRGRGRFSESQPERAHRVEVLDPAGDVVDVARGRRRPDRHRRHAAGAADRRSRRRTHPVLARRVRPARAARAPDRRGLRRHRRRVRQRLQRDRRAGHPGLQPRPRAARRGPGRRRRHRGRVHPPRRHAGEAGPGRGGAAHRARRGGRARRRTDGQPARTR